VRSRRLVAGVALLAALAAAPVAAGAATYTVRAGARTAGPVAGAEQNRFLPAALDVRVGDTVQFRGGAGNDHTVAFLGGSVYGTRALLIPEPHGAGYWRVLDAANQPFAFQGRPRWIYNVLALSSTGDEEVRPGRFVNAGLLPPPARPGVPLRFPKRGVYRYVCLIHPGMAGTITVRPKAARIPAPAAVKRAAARAEADGWKVAQALDVAPAPPDTVLDGPATAVPGGDVSLLAMRPAAITVRQGTTVTFRNDSTTERHNVAIGPVDYLRAYLDEQSSFPETPLDENRIPGDQIYGSESPALGPTGPFPFDGTNHGNGFISLAATDASPRTSAGPVQQITFTAVGTWMAYCLLHFPRMTTTVTVVP
jgi:plastocyanin